MKITFEWPFKTFSGTLQEMTYMSCRHDNLCLGRGWTKPEATDNNARLGRVAQNLKSIWESAKPAYKEDLKLYAKRFTAQRLKPGKLPPTAFGLFLGMMYAWQRSSAEQVDLSTVTVIDIVKLDAPVLSVARAVQAQLLVPVKGYTQFNPISAVGK